jgi:Phage integrase, N-terminal SAM-like domain
MHTMTLEKGLAMFLDGLHGKNRSSATIRAYQTDIAQLISFLHANNVSIQTPTDVEKVDVVEYLSALAKRELTGIARARKMSVAPQLTVVSAPPRYEAFQRMRGTSTLLGWCPARRWHRKRQQFLDGPAMIRDASGHRRCCPATGVE